MNVVNSFSELFFPKEGSHLLTGQNLEPSEIKEVHLQGILSHLKFCARFPSRAGEKYETLKENFPDIIHNPHVNTQQFLEYVRLLYPELDKKGDWHDGLDFMGAATAASRTDTELLECYLWLSLFSGYVTNYEQAMNSARQAINLAQELKDDRSLTVAMKYLARIHRAKGSYEKAIEYYDEVINIAEQRHDGEEIAHAYGSKGLTYWHLKEYESALHALQTSQDIFIRLGNEKRTGHTFNNMGLVLTELGLYDKALLHFERAVEIATRLGDKKELALTEGNIGMVYCFLRNHDTALAYLRRTMKTMDDLQHKYRLAKAKLQIAIVYWNKSQDTGDREIALQYAKEGYEIGLRHDIIHFQIIGASYQAIILNGLNRIAQAKSLSEHAVALLKKVRILDGLEEEIYFNHYLILRDGESAEANVYLKRSYEELQTKLGKLSDATFKKSFLSTDLHRTILGEVERNNRKRLAAKRETLHCRDDERV